MPVAQIDHGGPADFSRHIVIAVQRTGGGADGGLQIDAVFHQHIQHAGGIAATKSAALQNNAAGNDPFRRGSQLNGINAGPGLFLVPVVHQADGLIQKPVGLRLQPTEHGLTVSHHLLSQLFQFFFHASSSFLHKI